MRLGEQRGGFARRAAMAAAGYVSLCREAVRTWLSTQLLYAAILSEWSASLPPHLCQTAPGSFLDQMNRGRILVHAGTPGVLCPLLLQEGFQKRAHPSPGGKPSRYVRVGEKWPGDAPGQSKEEFLDGDRAPDLTQQPGLKLRRTGRGERPSCALARPTSSSNEQEGWEMVSVSVMKVICGSALRAASSPWVLSIAAMPSATGDTRACTAWEGSPDVTSGSRREGCWWVRGLSANRVDGAPDSTGGAANPRSGSR